MDTSHENRGRVPPAHLPHVVIVGGGFGGLYAARGLARAPVAVTLVDKHNYHLFRPMLYQVATGLLSSDEVAAPIRSVLRRQKNVTVLMAEVVGVDPDARVVVTREGTVAYDYLVLATGIEYNYFGHEEWKAIAPGLASVDDADRIRGKILTAFESAEKLAASGKADPSVLHELLTFVQVGAGTAGVEMAGTMAEMARMALAEDFRHIDPSSAHILLFEAAPRILPTYTEGLSEKARRHLEQLGVEVRTSARVERVDEHGVIVDGERIASRTVLWTAGVVASPAGTWLGVDVDRAGRIKVNPDLSVPGYPNVFAVGDTAAMTAETRSLFGIRSERPEPLPGVAQVAIQGGRYVARLIRRRVDGERPAKPFWYWDKGNMAIVGRTFAVADLKHARFSGFAAWLLWAGVHIYFLIGFANRLQVALQWAISFVTKRRGVRILPLDKGAPMKRITFLLVAIAMLAGATAYTAPASGQADRAAAPVFVTEMPPGYRDWRLISVAREEANLDDIRAILGNDVAIEAYRDRKLPFPEGTVIARLAWSYEPSEENNRAFGRPQSFVAGHPKNGVQFMVKDSKKYASTGGWGYGHFDDGKPAGETLLKTCHACHTAVEARDFVFTRYAP